MINFDARSAQGELLAFTPSDKSSGFIVRSIDGLGPVKAELSTSEFANLDGVTYHSASSGPRSLVIRIELDTRHRALSATDLRQQLYRVFMPKTRVLMRFSPPGHAPVSIDGIVEDFIPQIFVPRPFVDITIFCPKPDFVDLEQVSHAGVSTNGTTETIINYAGTAPTGVLFTLMPMRTVASFAIFNRNQGNPATSMGVSPPASTILSGDEVLVQTIPGEKYIRRIRGGLSVPLLYAVDPMSDWLILQPGINRVRVAISGSPAVQWSVVYRPKYGGL